MVQKVRELEILHSIGKLITSLLDLDELLTRIVEASVDITGAEEGYLLLVDEGTGELYLRAGQNLREEHAQGFRVKVHDSIAGSVVKTGKPEIAESKEGKSLKIKTGYQVKALLNVPLKVREKVIGVLGVNNKVSDKTFSEDNLHMLSVLADYAAIAIEKARLFSQLTETKERLNGLIASSLDAVIAIDQGKKITLFNRRAEEMFGWTAKEMEGQSVARLHVDFGKAQEVQEVVNREGTIAGWEIVLKHKDGTRIPALLSATLIRDSQGNPIGQAGFMRDLRQVNLLEERLRTLIRMSQAITGTLELDKVLDLIVESTVAAFSAAQSGAIHLYDERADILRVRAITRDYSADAIEALSLRVGEGIAGWVFQNQQPLVVDDAGQDRHYKRIDHPEVQDHRSMVCVPLRVKEQVIGALSLSNSNVTGAFQAEDLGLLSIFASQAAVAIMNAELMTKNRERLRKLEMLSRASNEMMSNLHSLGLDDRLNLIVRHAALILDAEAGSIFLVRRAGFLTKEACYGHLESDFQKGREFAVRSGRKTGLTGHIAYTGELFNAHGDDLVGHWAVAGKEPTHVASGKCHSLLAIPLKRRVDSGEQLIGLLEIENKKDEDGQPKGHIGFTQEAEWILSIFAETVVICLENAELYERTSDRLEEKVVSLRAIQETGAAISAELDLDELLELITNKAAKVFAAPAASLMLWDNRKENLVVEAKYGLTDEYTQQCIPREKVDDAIALMDGLHPLPTVDLRSTPFGRLDLIEAEHLCSVLSAPLAVSGKLIGILNIYSKKEPRQFTADEIEIAEVLAGQAAVAIRNAQLYEETVRRANALEVLYEAGKAVTSTLALDEILNRIVEQARHSTGHCGKQALFSDLELVEGNKLKGKAAYPPEHLVRHQRTVGDIDLEHDERIGVIGRAAKTGQSQLVGDVTQDLDYIEYDPDTRSELAVPIRLGEEVIGVINVEHPDFDAFDEQDQKALEALAAQAAIAIENARLFRETEHRALQLAAASEVARDATAILDAERLLDETVCLISERFGFYHAGVFLLDDKREYAVLHAASSEGGRRMLERGHKLKVGEVGIVGFVTDTGEPCIALDVGEDAVHFASPDLPDTRSEMALPLTVRGQVIGALDVQSTEVGAFTEGDVATLQIMADQLATAIRNAQLYEETIRRAEALRALYEAGKAVTSTLALDEILSRIVEQARWITGRYGEQACVSYLALKEGSELKFKATWPPGLLAGREDMGIIDLEHGGLIGITGRAVKAGQSQLVGDVTQDPDYIGYDPETRSELAVPIKLEEEVIGVINVEHPYPNAFDEEDRHCLEFLAAQAAIAIQNARQFRLREELLKAGEVVTAKGELYPALEIIAQSVKETIGCDVVCLCTYYEKRREVSYPSVVVGKLRKPQEQADWQLISQERRLPVDLLGERSVVNKLLEYGSSRFAFCSAKDSILGTGGFVAREGIESSAGILLKVGKEVMGILFVNYCSPHHFSEEERQATELFAYQAAVTIRNAQLYEETTRRASTLEALYQASRAVTSTLTLDELLDHVVEQAWRLAEPRGGKTHFSHLALTDGNYIKFAAAHPPEMLSTLQEKIDLKSDVPIGITGRVVLTGQSQLVGNVLEDHDYIETDPHVRSQLSVPIQMGEQVIGVIGVEHPDYEAFDEEDRHALEALAAQAAIAIENARLYEQTTQRLAESQTLQQVCVSLTETLELHTVLDRVMQAAIQLTGADEGSILFYDRKLGKFTDALTSPGPGQNLRPYRSKVRQRGGYSHTIVQQGQPVVIPDTHLDPSVNPVSIAKGRRAWVGVPLPGREGAIGVLWVTWRVPRHFSQHEVSLLVALASQAAVAIENARQYEELKQTRGVVGTMTAVAWMGTVAGAWRHAVGTYITTIEDLVKLIRLDLSQNLSTGKIEERLIDIEEVTSEIRKVPMPPLSMEAGVESVFINQLIAERIRQLQERKGRYKAVTYESDFALDDAATVRASPEWLRRLFDILVDNAVDAMADTPIKRLTITTHPADAGVEITVIDTGRGIPKDVLHKLFLEPVKKPKGAKGSGLGLFLARTIVQTYGGKLDIHSTGPTGTTMVVWLPVEA